MSEKEQAAELSAGAGKRPLFWGILIVAFSVALLFLLIYLKPEPKTKPVEEKTSSVKVIDAVKKNFSPVVLAYGTAEPVKSVDIHAEVKGRIVSCIPDFKPGVIVEKGETILEIDSSDYKVDFEQSEASIEVIRATISELLQKEKDDKERLEVLGRDLELSAKNLQRVRSLFEKNAISELELDKGEQTYVNRKNELIQLRSLVAQYPSKVASLRAQEKSAESNRKDALLALERCVIKSPFRGRIESESAELGQYLSAGQKILSIADDSQMEIKVPIDGAEAILLGISDSGGAYENWFSGIENLRAEIEWVDDPEHHSWQARAKRVEKYDPDTRTILLVVSPEAGKGGKLALTSGMFCRVRLFGREICGIFEIPRTAMQFRGKIAVVDRENRIAERDIRILSRGEDSFVVSEGISEGDMVVSHRIPFGMVNGTKVNPERPAK